jgi:ABC-type Mn2+/Zn2+ transport system permease subunit
VLPAVTGLLLAHGMAGTFVVSLVAAVVAAVVGFALSIPFDLPTGPTMIAVAGALVILAWLVRRLQRRA